MQGLLQQGACCDSIAQETVQQWLIYLPLPFFLNKLWGESSAVSWACCCNLLVSLAPLLTLGSSLVAVFFFFCYCYGCRSGRLAEIWQQHLDKMAAAARGQDGGSSSSCSFMTDVATQSQRLTLDIVGLTAFSHDFQQVQVCVCVSVCGVCVCYGTDTEENVPSLTQLGCQLWPSCETCQQLLLSSMCQSSSSYVFVLHAHFVCVCMCAFKHTT